MAETVKKSILIVDDEELNREILGQIFEDEYNIIMASNGKEALMQLNEHMKEIVLILLDLVMPVVSGYQVLKVLNAKGIQKKIPIILVTANTDEKVMLSCYDLGAVDFILKPFNSQVIRKRGLNMIEMYLNRQKLEAVVKKQKRELSEKEVEIEQFQGKMIDVMSNIVEFRNLESGLHVKRIKGLTGILAQTCMENYPEYELTRERIDLMVTASAMHDIGKIAIPDGILLKPSRLTDDERQVMMTHTTKGCEILKMLGDVQAEDQYNACYDICRHHHERYDGNGYPDGLKGEEISIEAQIVSIADVYDALVSERVYKSAFDKETAYRMICQGECGAFSEKLLNCLTLSKEAIELFMDSNQ